MEIVSKLSSKGLTKDKTTVETSDDWSIRDPTGDCYFQFDDDKLIALTKERGWADGEDAARMMSAFFARLAGNTVAIISTREVETSDHIRLRTITFDVGEKDLIFNITEPIGSSRYGPSVQFQEFHRRRVPAEKPTRVKPGTKR